MKKNDQRYLITIKKWEQHQTSMQGKGERIRRRSWVAISVDLFSDPDFLDLTITDSLCWVGLLLHAGKVGPEFELSPSYARVLFGLKHSPDFRRLADQGFIDLQPTTRQTRQTRQTEQDISLPSVAAAKEKKPVSKKKKRAVVPLTEGVNLEAWSAYVKNRRELKVKPLTPTGEKRQMNHFAKFSEEVQLAAVAESVRNGWQGVFPEKVKSKATSDIERNTNFIQEWLDDETETDSGVEARICEPDSEGVPCLPGEDAGQGDV